MYFGVNYKNSNQIFNIKGSKAAVVFYLDQIFFAKEVIGKWPQNNFVSPVW